MFRQKPTYPIREYLGRYESWCLKLYGLGRYYFVDRKLEKFFSHFPIDSCLSEFLLQDLDEYRLYREATTNKRTVRIELAEVRSFFKFLIEDCGFNITNPVRYIPYVPKSEKKKNRLSLYDLRRLLASIEDEPLRRFILDMVDTSKKYYGGCQFTKSLLAYAWKQGLWWMDSIQSLRWASRGLWSTIIQIEMPRLRKEFTNVSHLQTGQTLTEYDFVGLL